jgi:hypothetical protein
MRIAVIVAALAAALLMAGCMPVGLSNEQIATLKEQNGAILARAQSGQIKWVEYARAANANYMNMAQNDNRPETQEALALRVVLAQQVDAKTITPEQYDYQWKKFMADRYRSAMAMEAARENAIIASTPQQVTCNTIGAFTTCN